MHSVTKEQTSLGRTVQDILDRLAETGLRGNFLSSAGIIEVHDRNFLASIEINGPSSFDVVAEGGDVFSHFTTPDDTVKGLLVHRDFSRSHPCCGMY